MLKYQKHQRVTSKLASTSTAPTPVRRSMSACTTASNALNHGVRRLRSIDVGVRRSFTVPLLSATSLEPATPTTPREMTAAEKQAQEDREEAEDLRIVLRELQRYEEDGLEDFEGKMTDMVSFWNVSLSHHPRSFGYE